MIDEEKLDSFNVPYYTPSQFEVQDIVEREESFAIQHIETTPITFFSKQDYDLWTGVEKITKNIRSFTEPIISNHFGKQYVDKIYDTFAQIIASDWGATDAIATETIILTLNKI